MKTVCLLALLLSAAIPFAAQERSHPEEVTPEKDRPASDAHSFMELFTKLESDLTVAAQKKDQAVLDALVAQEFIERDAADPEHMITRDVWEKTFTNYKLDPLAIRSMVIRAFLGNAVVSFVQKQTRPAGSAHAGDRFIVDLWVGNRGKWQLASRFVSSVPASRR